jgi:hypothetical protein
MRAGRQRPPSARTLLGLALPDMRDAELITQMRGTGLATMPMVLLTTAARDGIKRHLRIR